jgi:predicted RNA-binding protein with RPS1 domain
MPVHIANEAEIESIHPKKRITFLFSYRRQLLDEAYGSHEARELIFGARMQLATIFEAYGSALHTPTVEMLTKLECPEDLLAFAMPPRTKKNKLTVRERRKLPEGFYVVGERFSDRHFKLFQGHHHGHLNGFPYMSEIIDLYRIADDGRPIYVNLEPITEDIIQHIRLLVQVRPEMMERIFFIAWEKDKARIVPIKESGLLSANTASRNSLSNVQLDLVRNVFEHEPKVGELFNGTVTGIEPYGLFVQILPGIVGLLHFSELINREDGWNKKFAIGDSITVLVFDIDINDRIKLSEKRAQQQLANGARPLFTATSYSGLLPGNTIIGGSSSLKEI